MKIRIQKTHILWAGLAALVGIAASLPVIKFSDYPRDTTNNPTDLFLVARTNRVPATNMGVTYANLRLQITNEVTTNVTRPQILAATNTIAVNQAAQDLLNTNNVTTNITTLATAQTNTVTTNLAALNLASTNTVTTNIAAVMTLNTNNVTTNLYAAILSLTNATRIITANITNGIINKPAGVVRLSGGDGGNFWLTNSYITSNSVFSATANYTDESDFGLLLTVKTFTGYAHLKLSGGPDHSVDVSFFIIP